MKTAMDSPRPAEAETSTVFAPDFPPLSVPGPWIAAAVVALLALAFAGYTGHAWEDYLITFRSSENLATGRGFVFQPGERVHGYTSPLGTLLPALFAVGGGEGVEWRALWCLRVVSALCLGAAVFIGARVLVKTSGASLALGALGLWIFDPKIIDFSINGMETGVLIFFAIFTWQALLRGAVLAPTALGIAGLQWTRPDGFVVAGSLVLAWLALTPSSSKMAQAKLAVKAIGLAILLYLPWLGFAWGYYGSPIPHTILAKQGTGLTFDFVQCILLYPVRLFGGHLVLHDIFRPTYFFFGGWPEATVWFSRTIATTAALAWLWTKVPTPARIASAAFFMGGIYLECIPRFPWYFPVWQSLAAIAWVGLLQAISDKRSAGDPGRPHIVKFARIAALVATLVQSLLLICVARQMKAQQQIVEMGNRREIGLWLKQHVVPGERVFTESLGYIGYYSGAKMLDSPGLVAPEVVAARRRVGESFNAIIQDLRPEWLVLRANEVMAINRQSPELLAESFRLARVFDAWDRIDSIEFLPGRGYLRMDAVFLVFERVATTTP